ncbi:MAG: hypothetical protein GQ525_16130 [Draconibacterium sp.]|nr:hypothetical protein [Draconibacterium sp.]
MGKLNTALLIANQEDKKFFYFLKKIYSTIFVLLLLFNSGISQERDAFNLVMNANDKATTEDFIEATQKTSKETQAMLQEGLENWKKLDTDFAYLNPSHPLRKMIDKVNASGFKNIIGGYQKRFKNFDSGLSNLLDKKEKLDNIIYFYDRYAPDKENPFRSLEVLNNAFTDVESLLPKEVEYEYFKNTSAWLIRTGIGYYKMAIGNALNGLKDIQKQIRNRAGDCIGYIGGDKTADRNDPKRKAFIDINNEDIICYTGLQPSGGKIYTDITGSKVYIWDSKKWTKFSCNLGDVQNIFMAWKLANESVISSENMIRWCNERLGEFNTERARGQMQFKRLSTIEDYSCRYYILKKLGKLRDFQSFMADVDQDHNQKLFIAKYIFKKDGVRNTAEMLGKIVSENIMFHGYVTNEDEKGLFYASVTIEVGSQIISVKTNKYGFFETLVKIPEKDHTGLPLNRKVTATNYSDFKETSVLQGQCMNLGTLEMKVDGQLIIQPASSTISRGETVDFSVLYIDADGNSSDVTSSALPSSQFTGTSVGTFPVTANYNNISIAASVEVTGQACKENEIWDAVIEDCTCKSGYERDENGKCIIIDTSSNINIIPTIEITLAEINNQLNNADCANVPDAVAKWDPVSEQVICTCTKDYYTWDEAQKKCVPNVQAILANSDCSQWPNSEPKWDYGSNEPYCDCISGYVWNNNYTECLSKQDLAVAQTDCSQYPNSQPIWDPISQEVMCDCLPGFEWDEDYTKCISKALAEMQNFDCSLFPNTEAIWDPVSKQAFCDCSPGYKWNEDYDACEKIQQQVQYDCSHLPNSRPIFDAVLDEVVCDCMPGYQWNSGQTGCVPIPRKPTVDWGNIINMTVGIMNAVNGNTQGIMPPGYNTGAGGQGVPQSMQTAVKHQSNCNDQQQAGGDPPEEHTIDLGQSYGSFTFDYNTVSQKDQIIVTNGGVTIFNSGCVGESKSIQLNLKGFSPTITVRVNPNCDGGSGTAWYFTVHCPNN